jgi:SAM-dependent methyltransferase
MRSWGRYPPEELIRFVAQNYYQTPVRSSIRILELGSGQGGNLWFLAREGFTPYGVEGSRSAVEKGEKYLAEDSLNCKMEVADISTVGRLYEGTQFDAVVDVCCLQHNCFSVVKDVLEQVRELLRPGGKVFSMMVAAGSDGDCSCSTEEKGTSRAVEVGPLNGKGLVHFFSLEEVEELFRNFADVRIGYTERGDAHGDHRYKHFVTEASRS